MQLIALVLVLSVFALLAVVGVVRFVLRRDNG